MARIVITLFSLKYEFPDADAREISIRKTGCHEKEGVSIELAVEYTSEHSENFDQLVEANPKLKCLAICLYEVTNTMDGCTSTISDQLREMVKGNPVKEAMMAKFEECSSNLIGTDRCECGYQIDKCVTDWMNKEIELENENENEKEE
ncbi:uncharacterized protein LOC129940481 isoform X2 [Eupeodes corollae]|uniref:uncharacterized protein LOC129940481 isoform X2 n=1 Tax=Eupeodes corollae TaxID=290404 RepID=UPI002490E7DB|nr:uncharacterized protein LOC129940481 isoform X2 [Eupeodes corollae]